MFEIDKKFSEGVEQLKKVANIGRHPMAEKVHNFLDHSLVNTLTWGFFGGLIAMGVGTMVSNEEIVRYGLKATTSTAVVGAVTVFLVAKGVIRV